MPKQIEIESYKPTSYQEEMHQLVNNGNWNEYVFVLSRQSGKSLWALNQILYSIFNNSKIYNIVYITPTYKLSRKVFKDFEMYLKDIPVVKSFNKSELIITFKNGKYIQFFSAENPTSVRGTTWTECYIDEGAFMDDDFYPQIIKPTLMVKNAKTIFITTPYGRNYIYEKYQQGQTDNKYIKSYLKTIYDNELITKDQIEEIRNNTPKHIFAMEFLCDFNVQEQGVFTNINEHINNNPNKNLPLYCGIDLGRIDYTVAVIFNSLGEMVDILRINKMSWDLIEEKIISFLSKYNLKHGFVEVNNIGDVIADRLIRRNNKLEIFKTTTQSKNPMIENLIVQWDNYKITIIDNEDVKREFETFSFKWNNSTKSISYSAPNNLHDDIVMASAMANWSIKTNKSKVTYIL